MSSESTAPKCVRPFNFHGCEMQPQIAGGDWVGNCFACGKDEHFFVNPNSGQWDCKVCGESGNIPTFLQKLVEKRHADMSRRDWLRLSKLRGMPSGVMKQRQVGWCPIQKRWLIPCRSASGSVADVRAWDGKIIKCTAGLNSQLFGAERLAKAPRGAKVWLLEGEWDGMAMDWLLRESKQDAVVVAVPGATTLKRDWVALFSDKDVTAVYDADEAGDKGAEKAARLLGPVVKSLSFVCWPDSVKKGWDLRDFASAAIGEDPDDDEWAVDAMRELEALSRPHPRRGDAAVKPVKKQAAASAGAARELPELRPMDFSELSACFAAQILMTPDLTCALKVMMAVALSNDIRSDPLWVYVVGAPGAGKTMLLQALQGSERCVFRSTITPHGLVSGWSQGDPSLVPRLSEKCLVVKDFTEILQMQPLARDEIYATLRGAFDGSVDKSFGNGVHRVYNRHTDPPFNGFSMLAGVTHAIHGHREASLGERFLKIQLKKPTEERAAEINLAALNSLGLERTREDDLQWAVACFLSRPVTLETLPPFTKEYAVRLNYLVNLVAFMRAQVESNRYTGELMYRPMPESGTRLTKQLGQLARLLAFIDGASEVGEEQFEVVERVAFDTAYGFHLEIVNVMMSLGGEATKKQVRKAMGVSDATVSRRFDDLQVLQVVTRLEETKDSGGGRPASVWRLDSRIASMWLGAKGLKEAEWKVKTNPSMEKRGGIRTSRGRKLRLGRSAATSGSRSQDPSRPRRGSKRPASRRRPSN